VKIKNPNYWRRDEEREAIARKLEREDELTGGTQSRAARLVQSATAR